MLEAALWGLVGGGSLVVGAALGLRLSPSKRAIGLVMAFGAGVLVSAAAFELTEEAFRRGGRDATAIASLSARWPSSGPIPWSPASAAATASARVGNNREGRPRPW